MLSGNDQFFNYYFINFLSTILINNPPKCLLFCNFLVILYHCIINSITMRRFSKLHLALQENVSRHGRDPTHGNGFKDLFAGLVELNADARFRSGDHALTISGARPDLKAARLSQKTPFQGLLVSVQCSALLPQGARH